jgi:hypothetical protein
LWLAQRIYLRFRFIEAHEVIVVISEPMPQLMTDTQRFRAVRSAFWGRLFFLSFALVFIGWVWPYEISNLPSHFGNISWMLGWFTVLVLLGAVCGYALRSRWSMLIAPLALYLGGVLHWLQFDWGLRMPDWPMFALVSVFAFLVLFMTAGVAAGIASRVIIAGRSNERPAEGIRVSAGLSALLGLTAITTIYVLPAPFLGGMLGLGALLAGFGLMEEGQVNVRERVLAIAGMLIGVTATGTQLMAAWSFLKGLL